MPAVDVIDAVGYGIRMLLYILFVAALGVVPILFGVSQVASTLAKQGILAGIASLDLFSLFLILWGVIMLAAGSLGALYKVIADGVRKGQLHQEDGTTDEGTSSREDDGDSGIIIEKDTDSHHV